MTPVAAVVREDKKPLLKGWIAVSILVCAGVLAYSNSLSGPFVFDDETGIVNNPFVRCCWPIWDFFRNSDGHWNITGRPVTYYTFAINYAIGGLNTTSYHVFNLIIHLLASLTLFGIVRQTLLSEKLKARYGPVSTELALACTLLWMLHPLQTESVTYIVQRSESLMGLFFLLTLYCSIRGWQSPAKQTAWFIASGLAYLLGIGSKEVIVTAPFIVFAYDYVLGCQSVRETYRRSKWLYRGYAFCWIVLGILVAAVADLSGRIAAMQGMVEHSRSLVLGYALTQSKVILHYLRLSVWPDSLCLFYGWPIAEFSETLPYTFVILILLSVSSWALWRRCASGFLAACFFIILAPTSSLMPLEDVAFEHRMYLPLASVSVLLVVGGYGIIQQIAKRYRLPLIPSLRLGGILLAVVAIALGVLTFQRNVDYRSAHSIWSDTVRKQPENSRAHNNLGDALLKQAKTQKAISHFRESLRLQPGNAEVNYNLGIALNKLGKPQDAILHYQEALRLKPEYLDAHNNLADVLLAIGKPHEAIPHYKEALRYKPEFAEVHYNLGTTLDQLGKSQEAIPHYQEALRLKPDYAEAHNNLGNALITLGKSLEAIPHYQEALRLKPDFANACNNLGVVLTRIGKPQEAIVLFREALKIDPNYGDARKNLDRLLQLMAER